MKKLPSVGPLAHSAYVSKFEQTMNFRLIVLTLLLLLIMMPLLSIAAEERTYAISSKYSPIMVRVWTEEESNQIMEFENSGLHSPVDALVTFFYFGKTNQIQNLLDMHYVADGTRNYVEELLEKVPDAFLGAKNLKAITIKKISYWGNHRTVFFNMVNTDNKSANWAEDFICENNQCLKSNFTLFNDSDKTNLYAVLTNSNNIPATKPGIMDTYSSYLLQPEYASNSEYPITLLIDKKNITPGVDTEWQRKLVRLKGLLEISDQDVVKIDSIKEFLIENYRDWDTTQFANPYFGRFSTEKDFLAVNLNRASDLRIDSFIENPEYVWVFAEAFYPFNAKSKSLLFVYNKQENKFELDGVNSGESRKIDTVLRHEFAAQSIFSENLKDNESQLEEQNKNKRSVETDSSNMPSLYFLIFMTALVLMVIGFVLFYAKFLYNRFSRK